MSMSTRRRESTIPIPTISFRWAPTVSRVEPERMLTSRTGKRAGSRGSTAPSNGFTMVEMFVVLLALAILAAAVVPALRGAGRQGDLDDAAARVAASARFARETALSHGTMVTLTVETSPEMIRLA